MQTVKSQGHHSFNLALGTFLWLAGTTLTFCINFNASHFSLCSPYPDVPAGAVIGYEDHITLQTLPNEGGQVDYNIYIYI